MYRDLIRETAACPGRVGVDPRHVEAWTRLEHPTLDDLSLGQFRAEVEMAIRCIDAAGAAQSESLARSFGL